MKLNEEKTKELLEKLNKVWKEPKICSVCGNKERNVSDIVFELREFHGKNMIIGGPSSITPVVLVGCKNCSHTLFFNAITLGLIDKNEPKNEKSN